MDHAAVFAPVTKASFCLTADSADIIADKAVAIATEARPGPVHIDVPITVANTQVAIPRLRRRPVASLLVPAPGPDLEKARLWLADAQRPIMIAGLDAMNDGAGPALKSFCEALGVPLITTYKAKGILPEDHPLCIGGAGLSPLADTHLLPFVRKADLVICAGYDPIEMRPGWREIWDPDTINVIDISAVSNTHYMHQSGVSFISDTGATLNLLQNGISPNATWVDGEVAAVKGALAEAFPTDENWGPAAIIDECHRALPANTLATADSGAHRILLSQMWACSEPRGLMQSSAFCTMGCAVPLAMGAKIASPDRPVVSFSGDAGFLMVVGELATAAELALTPIFVVFVDASLALIQLKQRQRQLKDEAVTFGRHDFATIATAFGGVGHTVSNRDELARALETAKTADTFTVIAAQIGDGAYDGRI
jgi:acetolactate synthase-1/2/3 large subunit